jgi:hypothetical protein
VGLAATRRQDDDATAVGGFPRFEGERLVGSQCRRQTNGERPCCIDGAVDKIGSSRLEGSNDLALASAGSAQDVDSIVPDGAWEEDTVGKSSFDDECSAVMIDPNGAPRVGVGSCRHVPMTAT